MDAEFSTPRLRDNLPTGASGSLVGTVAERSAAHLPAAGAYTVIYAWAALFVLAAGTALAHRDA